MPTLGNLHIIYIYIYIFIYLLLSSLLFLFVLLLLLSYYIYMYIYIIWWAKNNGLEPHFREIFSMRQCSMCSMHFSALKAEARRHLGSLLPKTWLNTKLLPYASWASWVSFTPNGLDKGIFGGDRMGRCADAMEIWMEYVTNQQYDG